MEFQVHKKELTIPEFFAAHRAWLPIFCVVTKDYQDNIFDEIFEDGQVLRIHGTTNVRRLSVRIQNLPTNNNSYADSYSLPVDHSLTFQSFNWRGKPGPENTLAELIKKNKFPMEVQFAKNQKVKVGNATLNSDLIPRLTLEGVYKESHLLGNTIKSGIIDLRPITIPLYLWQMRVAVVTGIKGQGEQEWVSYQADISRRLHKAADMFDFRIETEDISVYSSLTLARDEHVYERIVPLPGPDNDEAVYEDIEAPVSTHGTTQIRDSPLTPVRQDSGTSNTFHNKSQNSQTSNSLTKGQTIRPMDSHAVSVGQNNQAKDTLHFPSSLPPLPATSGSHFNSAMLSGDCAEEDIADQAPPLPPREKTGSSNNMIQTNKDQEVQQRTYINNIKRATVSPSQHRITEGNTLHEIKEANFIEFVSTEKSRSRKDTLDAEQICRLSIDDLTKYMTALRLEKYIQKFQTEMVDGRVLSQFDNQVLRGEFGFTAVEAIRMMAFVKDGHIPN